MNSKVEGSLKSFLGATNVVRLGGSDRYATASAINRASFTTSGTIYLANGAGFADALAGAALAGKNKAPLYTVRGTCVPAQVLADIKTLHASSVVLLGGTGALGANVVKLVACK